MANGIIEQIQTEIAELKAKVSLLESVNRIADLLERHKVAGEYLPVKSQQQIRDEIIEKAKRDLVELEDGENLEYQYVDYVVNREKRTVVALIKSPYYGGVYFKGIAKCAPDDCFNVHIGKAIALRRALGLEVPAEYLNAPQPTEVRVGDVVYFNNFRGTPVQFTATRVTDTTVYRKDGKYVEKRHDVRVIDDSRE